MKYFKLRIMELVWMVIMGLIFFSPNYTFARRVREEELVNSLVIKLMQSNSFLVQMEAAGDLAEIGERVLPILKSLLELPDSSIVTDCLIVFSLYRMGIIHGKLRTEIGCILNDIINKKSNPFVKMAINNALYKLQFLKERPPMIPITFEEAKFILKQIPATYVIYEDIFGSQEFLLKPDEVSPRKIFPLAYEDFETTIFKFNDNWWITRGIGTDALLSTEFIRNHKLGLIPVLIHVHPEGDMRPSYEDIKHAYSPYSFIISAKGITEYAYSCARDKDKPSYKVYNLDEISEDIWGDKNTQVKKLTVEEAMSEIKRLYEEKGIRLFQVCDTVYDYSEIIKLLETGTIRAEKRLRDGNIILLPNFR